MTIWNGDLMVKKKQKYKNKRILCIASMASNLDNFNRNNVDILLKLGYEVTLAANFNTKEDTNSRKKIDAFIKEMERQSINVVSIDFSRKIGNIYLQLKSIIQVRKLLQQQFDLIHCHSPICAAIVRLLSKKNRRKYGTIIVYTAHGFHFFRGAPLKNWIIFYPMEKYLSRYTDVLITINKEDFRLAKKKFHAQKTIYVPGVGIDLKKFHIYLPKEKKNLIYKEINIPEGAFIILSVGELNRNKNQEVIIKAIKKINNVKIHYIVIGIGNCEEYLRNLSKSLNIKQQVHFLGYRSDVSIFYHIADVFAFPSHREGLGLAALEAMAAGLPIITSNIHGINDYSIDGVTGFKTDPDDIDGFTKIINMLMDDPEVRKEMGKYNRVYSKMFGKERVNLIMKKLYYEELNKL